MKTIKIRQLHSILAPIMILPILFTVITGVMYQIAELTGFEEQARFIVHWHKGNFGYLDFQKSFPFLSGLQHFWLYWFGPLTGGAAAALFYHHVLEDKRGENFSSAEVEQLSPRQIER